MNLKDKNGVIFKADILFAHFDKRFNKNYIIYVYKGEIYASSYVEKDNEKILENNLSEEELEMINNLIKEKMREENEN